MYFQVLYSSPLDGHLLMRVSCSFEGGIIERGFLTMFEDIGGFGAWNRRWCVLSGLHLRYWRYPDDESKKVRFISTYYSGLDLGYASIRFFILINIGFRDLPAHTSTVKLSGYNWVGRVM